MSDIKNHLMRMASSGSIGSFEEWNEFSNMVLSQQKALIEAHETLLGHEYLNNWRLDAIAIIEDAIGQG